MKRVGIAGRGMALAGGCLLGFLCAAAPGQQPVLTLDAWRTALSADPDLDRVDDLPAFQEAGLRLGAALLDAGDAAGAREVLAALWVRDRIAAVEPLRIAALRRRAGADPAPAPAHAAAAVALAAACEADLAALPPNPGYDGMVRLRLAAAFLALGQAAEAEALAAKVEGPDAALLRAEAEGKRGDFSAALARLEALNAGPPFAGGARAAFLFGYDLVLSGKEAEGAERLAACAAAHPADAYGEAALFWEGTARRNLGDFGAAWAAWTRQLAAFPQGPARADAAYQLARLPLLEGKAAAAAAALDAWMRDFSVSPRRAEAFAARAECERVLGHGDEARAFLLQGAGAAGDFRAVALAAPGAAADFADVLRQAGRDAEAKAASEAVLAAAPAGTPEADRARSGLALLQLRQGIPDAAAREACRAALEKGVVVPDLAPATAAETLVGLGDVYALLDQPGKAVACYQRVYVMYGKWPERVAPAYWRSGQAFEKLGKKDEALATYRELASRPDLSTQPEAALAKKRLAELGGS